MLCHRLVVRVGGDGQDDVVGRGCGHVHLVEPHSEACDHPEIRQRLHHARRVPLAGRDDGRRSPQDRDLLIVARVPVGEGPVADEVDLEAVTLEHSDERDFLVANAHGAYGYGGQLRLLEWRSWPSNVITVGVSAPPGAWEQEEDADDDEGDGPEVLPQLPWKETQVVHQRNGSRSDEDGREQGAPAPDLVLGTARRGRLLLRSIPFRRVGGRLPALAAACPRGLSALGRCTGRCPCQLDRR